MGSYMIELDELLNIDLDVLDELVADLSLLDEE